MSILRVVVVVACLALAACGFHLRPQPTLPAPLKRVHVAIADPASALNRDLPRALERSGATVEPESGDGIAELRFPIVTFATEALSVGATARVREYTIRYHVEFDAVDSAGTVVVPPQTIELSRDFTFDETLALGVASEEEELRKTLQRDMVAAILRRLEAVGRRSP